MKQLITHQREIMKQREEIIKNETQKKDQIKSITE